MNEIIRCRCSSVGAHRQLGRGLWALFDRECRRWFRRSRVRESTGSEAMIGETRRRINVASAQWSGGNVVSASIPARQSAAEDRPEGAQPRSFVSAACRPDRVRISCPGDGSGFRTWRGGRRGRVASGSTAPNDGAPFVPAGKISAGQVTVFGVVTRVIAATSRSTWGAWAASLRWMRRA